MCLEAAFLSLARDGCLERTALVGVTQPINAIALYVAHARRLRRRRRSLETRLQAVGAPDVTFVLCADTDEISRLDAARRQCLHPEYARTRWSSAAGRLSNGTLSLALKHRLAHWDMHRRKLSAALVIEDDALLPVDLWLQLARYRLPADADLFFLGSYSKNVNARMTLSAAPQVTSPVNSTSEPSVHRRERGREPYLLGTVAYVVFARGAAAMQRPVYAEADVDLSLLALRRHCTITRCTNVAPPNQYGPTRWIAWPAAGEENTHVSGAGQSVRDQWRRWCGEALKSGRTLNRNCERFGFKVQG